MTNSKRLKVGFLATHPIQYYTPLFRALAAHPQIEFQVYYCGHATAQEQAAAGFGVPFEWDVSLFGGYNHSFLENKAKRPSTASFHGLNIPGVANRIAADRLDAIIINGWHFLGAWQTMWASLRNNVPFFLRSDSQLVTTRRLALRLAKRFAYPLFIRCAAGCLPAGQLARNYFLHYGAEPRRIFLVPHCVDDERMRSEARQSLPQREQIRADWKILPSQIAWLFAGKFIEKKRPLDFVDAIAELHRKDGKSIGVMIGDGPLRRACEDHAARVDAPIRFLGFLNQTEIVRGYVAGDALVLPSDAGETWGLVVNEAMLCGLPCFVSNKAGCGPDLIEDGVTGAVFPFDDPLACAGVLQRYASRDALAAMGQNALARTGGFSARVVANSIVDAISTIVIPPHQDALETATLDRIDELPGSNGVPAQCVSGMARRKQ